MGQQRAFVFVAVMMVGMGHVVLAAQGPRSATPALVPESLAGSVSFDLYCASCHGRTGKGDGPTAASLKTRPADLTILARRNGGTFPKQRVFQFVEGTERAVAHGSPDMPVWGPTLRALDPSAARVNVRLSNLVAFVESIQDVAPVASSPHLSTGEGSALFASFCVNCHGRSGRGDGPMATELRRVPPDLTMLAAHNGDRFPTERVRQIVTGSGPAAHGDRIMPVWGDAFSRLGESRAGAEARIDAIVRYLELLQQRRG
jgi:cytochrome c553